MCEWGDASVTGPAELSAAAVASVAEASASTALAAPAASWRPAFMSDPSPRVRRGISIACRGRDGIVITARHTAP